MLENIAQIACKTESQEGVAESLAAADAFRVFNPKFEPIIEPHRRKPAAESMSPFPSAMGLRSGRITFSVELVGTTAKGDPIHCADALKACGVAETLVAVTSATYKPATSSIPSVTMALYADGKIKKIWGARGKARLVCEGGQPGMIEMEFLGADFSVTDGAMLSGISYNAVMPPVFQDAQFTIDSYAAALARLEIDFGGALSLRKDANSSSGHKVAVVTGRDPILRFDPHDVLEGTEAFFANWRAGTLMALTTSIGSVAGNTIGLTAPKVQYQGIKETIRDGENALDIEALLCGNAGDDEWQIQIT